MLIAPDKNKYEIIRRGEITESCDFKQSLDGYGFWMHT